MSRWVGSPSFQIIEIIESLEKNMLYITIGLTFIPSVDRAQDSCTNVPSSAQPKKSDDTYVYGANAQDDDTGDFHCGTHPIQRSPGIGRGLICQI